MVDIKQPRSPESKVVKLNREGNCTTNITNICQISNLSLSQSPEKATNGTGCTFSTSESSETDSHSSAISPVFQMDIDVDCTNANTALESVVPAEGCLKERPVVEKEHTRRWLTHTAEKYVDLGQGTEYSETSTLEKINRHSLDTGMQSSIPVDANGKGGEDICDHNTDDNSDSDNTSNSSTQKRSIISSFKQQSDDRQSKSVRWSQVVQMKDVKFKIDRERNEDGTVKLSISEIAGTRLYLKGIERENRLALLRKKYLSDGNKDGCHKASSFRPKNCCTETCQRLYNLSKPMQEDGKRRRESIIRARKTRGKKVWIHSTRNISRDEATHLYRTDVRKWRKSYPSNSRGKV